MRTQIELQAGWWVSVSEADARRAANATGGNAADLELAGDPENHPQRIDLPGGPQYGKRPLTAAAATGAPPSVQRVTEEFVGPLLAARHRAATIFGFV